MNTLHKAGITVLGLLLAGAAFAQEAEGDLEATIRLMDEAEARVPDAVTREITLPDNVDVDSRAAEASAGGLTTANEAREAGREHGQSVAAEARENASEMAEAARENAENRSRADEFRPDPPDNPGPPDDPGPPNGQ